MESVIRLGLALRQADERACDPGARASRQSDPAINAARMPQRAQDSMSLDGLEILAPLISSRGSFKSMIGFASGCRRFELMGKSIVRSR